MEISWQAVFDALAEPVWLMDTQCRIVRCNRAAGELFGADIIGRPCWEAMHCAAERIPECPFPTMCETRWRAVTEVALGERWFRCTVDPLLDADGKIFGALHILWDITDRKHAEKLLREANESLERHVAERQTELENLNQSLRTSESRMRCFIESAPAAIAMFDRTMHYLAASRRWLSDYGLAGRDVLGLSHYEVFPEIPKRWRDFHQRGLAGEVVRQENDRFERADGSVQWLMWEIRPWFDLDGTIGGIVIFTEDVTGRKSAEESTTRSEQHFRLLFETMLQGVVYQDTTGRVIAMNPAAEEILGRTKEDLLGRTSVDEEQRTVREDGSPFPGVEHPGMVALRTGREVRNVVMGIQRRKEYRWININAVPVFQPGDYKPRQVYTMFYDITERKRAESALLASAAALQQAQQLASIGNWEWDLATDRHVWSPEIFRIYGRDPALPPAVYPEVKQYFTPESWERLAAAVEKGLAQGVAYECDAEVVRADGSRRWITARGQATRDAAGKTVSLHGTIQDITERKRVEQLLRDANRTLQAIRDCHEAMLRAGSEQELLQEICRIIVQSGERMAWVGFAEKNARKTVRPVAAAGVAEVYLKKARITWSNSPRGRGPMGTAIRTGKVTLTRNTFTDPQFEPWRAGAQRHGFGSVIALPLMADRHCFGALAIYAAEPDAFDADEQLLLTDLANDLAFGIATLRLRAERQRLENEIFKSIEREQERIGRDLHDGLCQLLVGAKFRAVYLQKIADTKPDAAAKEAGALEALLNQAIEQARDLARGLNPVKVAPSGLTAALQKLADDVESAHGTHCFCQIPDPVSIADHQVASHLFRIAQEAVQNALKHAHARNISVSLTRQQDRLILTIKDDGIGIPSVPKKAGMGLNNMQTRARLMGGRLEIRRRKHGGTAVSCELPFSTQVKL